MIPMSGRQTDAGCRQTDIGCILIESRTVRKRENVGERDGGGRWHEATQAKCDERNLPNSIWYYEV